MTLYKYSVYRYMYVISLSSEHIVEYTFLYHF